MPVVIGTGSFLLFLSLALNIVALLVPYWYVVKAAGGLERNYGLWGSCTCNWYYTSLGSAIDDNKIEDWFKAAQFLYAIAVIVIVITLFMVFTSACLRESGYTKLAKAAGSLMLIAAVLIAVAIILFGVKGKSDYGLALSGNLKFDWGLWMGVAGVGISIISAMYFFIQGGRQNLMGK